MIDKKVVSFVDRCVAREYRRKQGEYDRSGLGEIGALSAVKKRLEKCTIETDMKQYKNNQQKGLFLLDALQYASRVDEYYINDYYNKSICKDAYYRDAMWEHKT